MKRFFVIFMATALLYTGGTALLAPAQEYVYREVTVGSGDTVWEIASRYCEGEDIRDTIFRICEANNLRNKNIYPGQVLKVPVSSSGSDVLLAAR